MIGAGDLGHGLCHVYKYNVEKDTNYTLEVTEPLKAKKPTIAAGETFHDTSVPVVHLDESIDLADILVLAIPPYALQSFITENLEALKSGIVVDCTNSSNPGEDVKGVLESIVGYHSSDVRWVKAFNDTGAGQLLSQTVTLKSKFTTKICGSDPDAVETVKDLAEKAFGFDVKVVPLDFYDSLATHQNTLGAEWLHSTFLLLAIFALAEIYAIVRYNHWAGYDWFHLPIQVTNKAICWTAIYGFALAQLPGTVAKLIKAFNTDSFLELPTVLKWGLGIRKHVGLLSLYFLAVHVLMSYLIFSPAYFRRFFLEDEDPNDDKHFTKLTKKAEVSFFFGILGFSFYIFLGICSLHSVGVSMTNRQWRLIYGPLVWLALIFGSLHAFIMGYAGWTNQERWPGNLPPITLMSLLVPMLVMFVKIVQVFVCTVMKFTCNKSTAPVDNGEHTAV
jgi:predicted dinucleotide-binding enzyme